MELFIVVLLTVILYKVARAFLRLPGERADEPAMDGGEALRGGEARWYGPSECPTVQSYSVPGGLVYIGRRLPGSSGGNDAALIDPDLDAADEPLPPSPPPGPLTYRSASPALRGGYLAWLSGGRRSPDAPIAFVLLFFYGLERRLFVDGVRRPIADDERTAILAEIRRLRALYGTAPAFRGYGDNAIATDWALRGGHGAPPDDVDFTDRRCAEPFLALMAAHTARGRPVPGGMALQWLLFHGSALPAPALRHPDLFRSLFLLRYGEKYGDGLVLHGSRTPLRITYRGASPSMEGGVALRIPSLQNPFVLRAPLRGVELLAESCAAELKPYDDGLSRGVAPDAPEALALLPAELLAAASVGETARNRLSALCGDGPALVEIGSVYEALGLPMPMGDGIENAVKELRPLLGALGFGMAPDASLHGMEARAGSRVALYGAPPDGSPHPEFAVLVPIVRLGALVAQASGDVTDAEERVLRDVVASSDRLTPPERRSMEAFLLWCLGTPQDTRRLRGALRRLPEAERTPLSRILVAVASADGRVDLEEMKRLGVLYDYLGLGKERVASDVHGTTVPEGPRERSAGEGFGLDRDLIRIRQEETRRVNGVLRDIFEEERPSEPAPLPSAAGPHGRLLAQLARKSEWERAEFRALCASLGLPPEGAMEVLNEWGYAAKSLPVLEDGSTIYVDTILAQEVLSHDGTTATHPAP